jgi:hypothetical protein
VCYLIKPGAASYQPSVVNLTAALAVFAAVELRGSYLATSHQLSATSSYRKNLRSIPRFVMGIPQFIQVVVLIAAGMK